MEEWLADNRLDVFFDSTEVDVQFVERGEKRAH